jgi:putative transposase
MLRTVPGACQVSQTSETTCYSWKHYTAAKIHRAMGRMGRFWQEESFDHLVRTPEQFGAIRRYIAANASLARLRAGEYIRYQREQKLDSHAQIILD